MTFVPAKRGRGRPPMNAARSDNNEFDSNLIEQYRQYQFLYDQSHPLYRSREETVETWNNIAQILNAKVSVLKDRIAQLRIRYNNERRRLETLQMTYPNAKSSWYLYDKMSFLDEHIRTRSATPAPLIAPLIPPQRSARLKLKRQVSDTDHSDDEEQTPPASEQRLEMQESSMAIHNGNLQEESLPSDFPAEYVNVEYKNFTDEKFQAFGRFVGFSLIEMDEQKALAVLNKMSNDLVDALKENAMSQHMRETFNYNGNRL